MGSEVQYDQYQPIDDNVKNPVGTAQAGICGNAKIFSIVERVDGIVLMSWDSCIKDIDIWSQHRVNR